MNRCSSGKSFDRGADARRTCLVRACARANDIRGERGPHLQCTRPLLWNRRTGLSQARSHSKRADLSGHVFRSPRIRSAPDPRRAAAPAGRVPDGRGRRRRAVRGQGPRPQEARRLVLQQGRRAAHGPHARQGERDRDHGDAFRSRGAAPREHADHVARAALQRAVPRRQVLPVPHVHRARVPPRGVLPRRGRQAGAVLRALPERVGGQGQHPGAAEGVPAAHLRGHGVCQPLAALPAAPDPALQRPVRAPDRAGRVRRRRRPRGPVPARAERRRDARAGRADAAARVRTEVRGGGGGARPDRGAGAGAAPAGGGHDRVRRGRRRAGGGHRRRPRLREPGDGAGRTAPGATPRATHGRSSP